MGRNLKIKSIVSIFVIVMIVIMNTIVFAADTNYSAGISLTSNSKLKEGETVTINMNLTSVSAGDGIDTLTASIEYDTNVFETLSTSSFTSNTSWTPTFAEKTNKMTGLKNQKVTAPEAMFTITLKVKQSISVDTTTIKLKNIVVSGGIAANGGTGDIKVNDASVTISKEKQAESTTEKPTTENPTTENPSTNTPTKVPSNSVTTKEKDSTTTKKTTLPKTGEGQYGAIAIAVVLVLAVISLIVYKKISRDVK